MAMRQAMSVFVNDKPHSSISDWIEILSGEQYTEEELDGIPELVDSINLQVGGPTEASRAIRKKLKYGNVHRQLRALTILKALVENGGSKFQSSFADDRLTEHLKRMGSDSHTDQRVKKRLLSLLASWQRQFKDDPSMRSVANLYNQFKSSHQNTSQINREPITVSSPPKESAMAKAAREKEERKAKERQAEADKKKLKQAQKEAAWNKDRKPNKQRKPFNFEQEKPVILSSIANASQCSNNLINALKLVNREKESIQENKRVQETLVAAKAARKSIVRYVQLVENEELIGTLIDTNERIIAALEMYDLMLKTADHDSDDTPPPSATSEHPSFQSEASNSQLERLQEKQRAAVERAIAKGKGAHPDLQDLQFEEGLPPPMKPTPSGSAAPKYDHGSLSDYSDYDSSADEGAPSSKRASTSGGYDYRKSLRLETDDVGADTRKSLLDDDDDDPFADPFADQSDVGTPGIPEKGQPKWTITT